MKQWDIHLCPFPGAGSHPAVILSSDGICADSRNLMVNVLLCTSWKPGTTLHNNEALLNGADGLDWETIVRCDLIHAIPRAALGQKLGEVSVSRRIAISKSLIACFKLQRY